MIECFCAPTPNSRRVTIMLEECGFSYKRTPVDLVAGEQKSASFLSLNPAGSVPVIIDYSLEFKTPLVLTQSGAICLYLAEKSGQLLPIDPHLRAKTLQWFAWALSDLSGTATALYRLGLNAKDNSSGLLIMEERMVFLLRQLNAELEKNDYIAQNFSIADVAAFPVLITPFVSSILHKHPYLNRVTEWVALTGHRTGVQAGL